MIPICLTKVEYLSETEEAIFYITYYIIWKSFKQIAILVGDSFDILYKNHSLLEKLPFFTKLYKTLPNDHFVLNSYLSVFSLLFLQKRNTINFPFIHITIYTSAKEIKFF